MLKKHIQNINLLEAYSVNDSKLQKIDLEQMEQMSFINEFLFKNSHTVSTLDPPKNTMPPATMDDDISLQGTDTLRPDNLMSLEKTSELEKVDLMIFDDESNILFEGNQIKSNDKTLQEETSGAFEDQGLRRPYRCDEGNDNTPRKLLDEDDFFYEQFKIMFSKIHPEEQQNFYLAIEDMLNQQQ